MSYLELIASSIDLTRGVRLTAAAGGGGVVLWPGERAAEHSVKVLAREVLQHVDGGLALAGSWDNDRVRGSVLSASESAVVDDFTSLMLIYPHLIDTNGSSSNVGIKRAFMVVYTNIWSEKEDGCKLLRQVILQLT